MTTIMEVYDIGANVLIADMRIDAVVLSISINDGHRVQYQVAWWDKNIRQTAWMEAFEVSAVTSQEPKRRTIGFVK